MIYQKFVTDDGYKMYRVRREDRVVWVDNLDPELRDLTFNDDKGWPVDFNNERLSGEHRLVTLDPPP